MNIVFALIPEKGHVNPYIGPAQALSEMGHTVTVAAPGDLTVQLAAAGLAFAPDLVPAAAPERPTHGAALVALVEDPPRLAAWIEALLLAPPEAEIARLRACFRRLGAEAVVIDPLYYPAALAAHAERLPWISVSNSLNPLLPPDLESPLLTTVAGLHSRRAALFAAHGLAGVRFSGCDVLSPFGTLAFAAPALAEGLPLPAGVELVGPSFPLYERGDEVACAPLPPDRAVIYASFGSQIYHWPALFTRLIAAARPLPVHLVLSLGGLRDQPEWAAAPANCTFYRYAPQLALLNRARVFVTHGGANSFMEAIAANVPMLLSPLCNDQDHQAFFTRRHGLGRVADLRTLTAGEITAHLAALLADGPHRAAVAAMAAAYRLDGARAAARRIVSLAG